MSQEGQSAWQLRLRWCRDKKLADDLADTPARLGMTAPVAAQADRGPGDQPRNRKSTIEHSAYIPRRAAELFRRSSRFQISVDRPVRQYPDSPGSVIEASVRRERRMPGGCGLHRTPPVCLSYMQAAPGVTMLRRCLQSPSGSMPSPRCPSAKAFQPVSPPGSGQSTASA